MTAVILDEQGAVHPLDIGAAARVDLLVFRNGGVVRKYTVLSLCDSMAQAVARASELRKEQRERMTDDREQKTEG